MNRRLFVGNLSFNTEESTLQDLFSQAGPVESVRVMRDQATGRSRGFGFVEMQTPEEATHAVATLNGSELDGRTLKVEIARPKRDSRSDGAQGGYGKSGSRGGWR